EQTLRDWNAPLRHIQQSFPRGVVVGGAARPAELLAAFPRPPVSLVRLAIERALARHRDVFPLERVDERRIVHELRALEAREHRRQILLAVARERERRASRYVKIDIAREMNRT